MDRSQTTYIAAAWATPVVTTLCLSFRCASDGRRKHSHTTQNITRLQQTARCISASRIWIDTLRKSFNRRPSKDMDIMLMLCFCPASEALANVNTPSLNYPPYANLNTSAFSASQPLPIIRTHTVSNGTISPQSLHPNTRPWDYKSSSAYPSPPCEDSFMTWEPTHRSSEWPQSAPL